MCNRQINLFNPSDLHLWRYSALDFLLYIRLSYLFLRRDMTIAQVSTEQLIFLYMPKN